jgi:hypothetical protein
MTNCFESHNEWTAYAVIGLFFVLCVWAALGSKKNY